jgi:hypothetical protein
LKEVILMESALVQATLDVAKVKQVIILSQQSGISEQQQGVSRLFLCVSAGGGELWVKNDCHSARHRQTMKVKTVFVDSSKSIVKSPSGTFGGEVGREEELRRRPESSLVC